MEANDFKLGGGHGGVVGCLFSTIVGLTRAAWSDCSPELICCIGETSRPRCPIEYIASRSPPESTCSMLFRENFHLDLKYEIEVQDTSDEVAYHPKDRTSENMIYNHLLQKST